MIRERMRHRKNLFQRILSVMLALALAAVSALGTGRGIRAESGGEVIYLDGVSGDNGRDGKSEDEAVATFSRAKELVGDKGAIRVCGTVTVSGSESWSLGGGVSLKRAHGFTDAVAHVTGSLKLSGITLYNKDVTGSGSVSGLAGRSPAADITVPSTVTLVQPKALSEVSLADQCFGVGAFVWADGSFVPDKYETQTQIIFTPSDTDEHDYSGLKGWNGESVIRKVKVLTQSFLEDEKKEDASGDAEKTETDEKAEEADQAGSDVKAEDADQAGSDEKAEDTDKTGPEDAGQADEGKTDGAEASGDEKPEDGSGKEDQKADSDSGKEDTGDGKTDGEAGKENPDTDDEKTDDEPGKDQEPEGGEADAPKDEEQPDEGSDTPAGEEQPGDLAGTPGAGSGPEGQEGEKPAGETDGETPEEQPGAEDKKDEPAETWDVEKVEQLLAKLPETVTSQSDVDAVVQASGAYEKLGEEAQAVVSGELLDKLYEAQSRVLGYNRVSLGVTVQGDLPWYIQFRASITEGQKIDDSTMRTLLESYEFKLWNLVTDSEYKLNGKTVTVLMAAPAVKDTDIVIYHYLEDGTVEQIIPEIEGDQMSFVTSSFSPFSVIGVSVAGSTELVGSTGFSYVDKEPGSGSASGGNSSTGNRNTGGSSSSSTGGSSSSTRGSSSSTRGSSSSTRGSSSSAVRSANSGSSAGTRRASAVGTGDTNNLLGYALVGSGAAMLMLFAAYMIYVQYKRKSYSRRS